VILFVAKSGPCLALTTSQWPGVVDWYFRMRTCTQWHGVHTTESGVLVHAAPAPFCEIVCKSKRVRKN
jgi:hypothetical protein